MSSFINFKNFGDTSNSPLTRQSSIYSLTFDELQTTLGGSGKDFGSMNMDELLKNIWSAEETQAIPATSFGMDGNTNNNINVNTSMQRQGSLTLPRTLSQKTVDEVWRELLKTSNNGGIKDANLIGESNLEAQQREPTLGEMTLEDFLLKAGVATENNANGRPGRPSNAAFFDDLSQQNLENSSFVFGFQNPNQNHGFDHGPMVNQITETKTGLNLQPKPQSQPQLQPLFHNQAALNFGAPLNGQVASPVARVGKTENLIKTSVVQASGSESGVMNVKTIGGLGVASPQNLILKSNLDTSPSPPFYGFGEGGVRGRRSSGTLEKVVERRRRRMIKNRESAARSRARKQAYTLDLEAEVVKLKELNHELLKKQEEIIEMQNNQVVEKMKLPWGSKRLCLRRTLTGPW